MLVQRPQTFLSGLISDISPPLYHPDIKINIYSLGSHITDKVYSVIVATNFFAKFWIFQISTTLSRIKT